MTEDSASYCRLEARAHDADAYLAALFAPEPQRSDLWALQAFSAELARVPALVSEPMLGEIRLQWWREALEGLFAGRASTHPVIAALADVCGRVPLPLAPFLRLIDARTQELYPASLADEAALRLYLDATGTDPLRLAVEVLAPGQSGDAALSPVIETGGRALGLAQLFRHLPAQAKRGRIPLSTELLGKAAALAGDGLAALKDARARLRALRRPALLPAFLPLSVIEPGLAHAALDPLAPRAERPLFLRQLRYIGASLSGRI